MGLFQSVGSLIIGITTNSTKIVQCVNLTTGETISSDILTFSYSNPTLTIETTAGSSTILILGQNKDLIS